MFDLDHFLDENNWMLDYWGRSVCIFYKIRVGEIDQKIYLLKSGDFYSPLFNDDSFKDEFLRKTKETKYISIIPEPSEFNFNKNNYPKEILKQKLNQIKERNSIFTKEDFNEIFK